MAAPALELRPRTTVALYDAALRVCSRDGGVWALTLPSGVALTAAVFELVEVCRRHESPFVALIFLTLAWCLRALSQGAACRYLEGLILEPTAPTLSAAVKAAIGRAPSLWITMGWSLSIHLLAIGFTGGLALMFLGALTVGYAVTMRGQGHPLALFGTAKRLLGPTRQTAALVRLCGVSQLVLFLNLQLSVTAFFWVANNLLGLDLTYLARFASFDNPSWMAAMLALTFTLFEPVRAATATLLLIDGRVRMEGLDLITALEQLPKHRTSAKVIAAGSTAAVLALLFALPAFAQGAPPAPVPVDDDWSGVYTPGAGAPGTTALAMKERLQSVIEDCQLEDAVSKSGLDRAGQVDPADQAALSRFVQRIERLADQEDCDAVRTQLRDGLKLLEAPTAQASSDPRAQAQKILERPEFAVTPEAAAEQKKEDEPPTGFRKWWKDLIDSLMKKLREWLGRHADDPTPAPSSGFEFGFSNVVVVVAVAGAVMVLAWIFMRYRANRKADTLDAGEVGLLNQQQPLTHDPMSALSKPTETWAGLADTLAARGQYRDAIRHLYLALLSRLHRDGAIDYDPAKSNWDYFRGFQGDAALIPPFRELTRRFDFAWYGNLEVSAESWSKFRALAEPLLATRPEAAVA